MVNSEDEAETPALRKRVLVSGDEHRNPVHRLGKTVKTSTKKGFSSYFSFKSHKLLLESGIIQFTSSKRRKVKDLLEPGEMTVNG